MVIDQEDKRILNAISENLSNFIVQGIEDTKDTRWNFWLFIFHITIVIDMFQILYIIKKKCRIKTHKDKTKCIF